MEEICAGQSLRYSQMTLSQNRIGWRRSLEGMISKEVAELQRDCDRSQGKNRGVNTWAAKLVTQLMEITYGQWLYRNPQPGGARSSIRVARKRTERKDYMDEIERCQELGPEALLEEDQCLLQVNLGDMESLSGGAIKAARKAKRLATHAGQAA